MKNQRGSTPFLVLVLIGIVVLVLSAGSYYYLQYTGKIASPAYTKQETKPVEQADEVGVSNSDDISSIESELDKTDIGSIDDDMEEIQSDLSEL